MSSPVLNVISNIKQDAMRLTDKEVREAIKALRAILLARQQRRASEKYVAKQANKGAGS